MKGWEWKGDEGNGKGMKEGREWSSAPCTVASFPG